VGRNQENNEEKSKPYDNWLAKVHEQAKQDQELIEKLMIKKESCCE